MARFVDLDEDDIEPAQHGGKPVWNGLLQHRPSDTASQARVDQGHVAESQGDEGKEMRDRAAHESVTEVSNPNWNAMTEALGCYP
jgi:hypothetical protein